MELVLELELENGFTGKIWQYEHGCFVHIFNAEGKPFMALPTELYEEDIRDNPYLRWAAGEVFYVSEEAAIFEIENFAKRNEKTWLAGIKKDILIHLGNQLLDQKG